MYIANRNIIFLDILTLRQLSDVVLETAISELNRKEVQYLIKQLLNEWRHIFLIMLLNATLHYTTR